LAAISTAYATPPFLPFFQSFAELQQQRGAMPETLRSATGGGGRHLLYRHPPGFVIPSRKPWIPGVDVKSDGGYVVLPESNHKSGVPYRWLNWGNQATPLPPDIANSIMSQPAGSNGSGGGYDLADTADEVGEAEAPRLNLKRGSEIRNRDAPRC